MVQRKEIEDYLFNHDDQKSEKKMYMEEKGEENKWSLIFKKIKESSLNKFIKK